MTEDELLGFGKEVIKKPEVGILPVMFSFFLVCLMIKN
jgi:hypothetical protein